MLYDFIGFVGMALILAAFVMEQFHKWKDDSFIYGACNGIGSTMMMIYALALKSPPFFILNLAWAVISIRDVYKSINRK